MQINSKIRELNGKQSSEKLLKILARQNLAVAQEGVFIDR